MHNVAAICKNTALRIYLLQVHFWSLYQSWLGDICSTHTYFSKSSSPFSPFSPGPNSAPLHHRPWERPVQASTLPTAKGLLAKCRQLLEKIKASDPALEAMTSEPVRRVDWKVDGFMDIRGEGGGYEVFVAEGCGD